MKPFKTYAYIYSLNRGKLNSTEMDEITILEKMSRPFQLVQLHLLRRRHLRED